MITTYRNEDFSRSWRFQTVDGQPIAVPDATCEFTVLDGYDTMNEIFSCSDGDFITIDEENGLFECFVPAESFTLPAGDYVMYCRAQFVDDEVTKTVILEDNYLYVRHLPPVTEVVP